VIYQICDDSKRLSMRNDIYTAEIIRDVWTRSLRTLKKGALLSWTLKETFGWKATADPDKGRLTTIGYTGYIFESDDNK